MSMVKSCTHTELDKTTRPAEVKDNEAMVATDGLPLESYFCVITQSLILFVTILGSYYLVADSFEDLSIFITCGMICLMFLLLIKITNTRSTKCCYKFEVIYSIYLPFMMSLLFTKPLTVLNTVLSLNVINQPLYLRVLTQVTILTFTDYKISYTITAVLTNCLFASLLAKVGQLKSLDNVDCNLFSILLTNIFVLISLVFSYKQYTALPFQILRGALTALLITIAVNYVLSRLLSKLFNKFQCARSVVMLSVLGSFFPYLTQKFIAVHSTQPPLLWLIDYIVSSSTRKVIFTSWLTFIIIFVPNIIMFKSKFSLNSSRKIWHFLIFLIITIPYDMDPTFVQIALAGVIPLFICVEYLRYLKLAPLGEYLDMQLRQFADYRDAKGPLIISYIYLIVGISFPLFIYNSPSGLISLGIGDSLASIVGKKFGRCHWPNSDKTIEGTFAFVTSTFVVANILKIFLGYFSSLTSLSIFIICFLSGVLEGNSILNDNILIPSFMLICERILTE